MPTVATLFQESQNDSGEVINLFEGIFLRKALRIVVQIERSVNKCKNKKTKFFWFVAQTELQEVLELSLRQEKHKFYQAESITLEAIPHVKPQSKLKSFIHSSTEVFCAGVAGGH